MTGNEMQTEVEFNEKLAVGQVVEARWTNCYNSYACAAEVVKVNRQSLRVKLLKNHGPYMAGHVIVLPKLFDLRKWSTNNGAFPPARYSIKCDTCKKDIGRTNELRESAAGGTCEECKRYFAKQSPTTCDPVTIRAAMMKLHGCTGCGGRDEHRSFTCPVLAAEMSDAKVRAD